MQEPFFFFFFSSKFNCVYIITVENIGVRQQGTASTVDALDSPYLQYSIHIRDTENLLGVTCRKSIF